MMYEFLLSIGLLHWIAAFFAIMVFLVAKSIRITNFSWQRWFRENLISSMWSIFILSLVIPMLYIYIPVISLFDAALMGYVGAHLIFCFTEPRKTHCRIRIKDPGVL